MIESQDDIGYYVGFSWYEMPQTLVRRKPRKELFRKGEKLRIDPDFKRYEPDYYYFRDLHKLETIHDAILDSAHLIWNYQNDLACTAIPPSELVKPQLARYMIPSTRRELQREFPDMVDHYLEKAKDYGFTSAATASMLEYTNQNRCVPALNQRAYGKSQLFFSEEDKKLYRRHSLP